MLDGQLGLTDIFIRRRFSVPHGRAVAAVMAGVLLLAGCASQKRAPVVDLSEQPVTPVTASPGGTYVVKPRDTLFQIARAHNIDVNDLARWNNIGDRDHLKIGQVLQLSGKPGGRNTAASTPASASTPATAAGSGPAAGTASGDTTGSTTDADPIEAKPLDPVGPAAPGTPAGATPAPAPVPKTPTPARAADANLITWGWPANGAIIQSFSAATKGIDISGNPGDPVVAAADGKVMYSGNGVRGLGNLIIINHQNGFITAYAHNRTLLVKPGQDVKRGARIAEMGDTDTSSPRLHFELRRQGTPVNPLQYLPAR